MVTIPTTPCRPRLAQVSQRADAASGTAITVDSAPCDHRADPEQRDIANPTAGLDACDTVSTNSAADPAIPCIKPTSSVRQRKPCHAHARRADAARFRRRGCGHEMQVPSS